MGEVLTELFGKGTSSDDLRQESSLVTTTSSKTKMDHPPLIDIRQTAVPGNSKEMPGVKRSRDGAEKKETESSSSPFMPMFEVFRNELDEHHDRRERIIKASRDITAASKKM